jgi:beta-galactosidase
LAEKVRSLDSSRFVTEAISGFLIADRELFAAVRNIVGDGDPEEAQSGLGLVTNTADGLNRLAMATSVDANSVETFSYLDVAGYNYMERRFEVDAERYRNRVMMGSETHPVAIGTAWDAVCRHPQLIGDFTWTGWDYLGEVGIGRIAYGEPTESGVMPSLQGEYPWRFAWCGDIDITGRRRPQSFYREIVFGLRAEPYLAVQRPQHHSKPARATPWSWTDVVPSWTWAGFEGAPVAVEVYAHADEVELLVNGQSSGRKKVGEDRPYLAAFEAVYEPGDLEAVAWRDGKIVGRSALRTARDPVRLQVQADRAEITAQPGDLAFVSIQLVDGDGVEHRTIERQVEVQVEGTGTLLAFGSANPVSEEQFSESKCTTYEGRAVAVLRPIATGRITATVTSEGCEKQQVLIDVVR